MVYDFTIYPIELVLKILFALLSSATHSYLLAIILLSIAVRIVTKPLEKIADKSVKQERALSEVLIPQINKIKTNLQGGSAHDAIKRLYSRYGYHPIYSIRSLAGLFVQLPFFLAAFYMLSGFEELRGVHIPLFGDLGRPDALLPGAVNLMPFIMVIANLLALFTTTGFKRKDIVQGLIIAILFLFLLYNSPLALLIYWTTNNIISLALNFCSKLNFKIPSLRSYKKYNRFKDVFFEYGYIYFLFNIAISVPILGVLGDQYVFFSAHNLDGEYVLRFLILFTTIPPLLIACLRFLAKYFGFTKAYDFFVLFLFLSLFLTYTFNKVGYGVLPTIYEPYVFLFVSLVLAIVASIIICNNFIKELSIISVIVPLVLLHFILISPASALFSNVETINKKEIAASINDTPVFLFVFDEFSGLTLQTIQRNLNASRYPGFAELAAYSDYFPNALTGATETKKSIPNILSGNYRSAEYPAIPPVNNLIDFFNSTSSVNCHSPILSSEFNTLNKNYKKMCKYNVIKSEKNSLLFL